MNETAKANLPISMSHYQVCQRASNKSLVKVGNFFAISAAFLLCATAAGKLFALATTTGTFARADPLLTSIPSAIPIAIASVLELTTALLLLLPATRKLGASHCGLVVNPFGVYRLGISMSGEQVACACLGNALQKFGITSEQQRRVADFVLGYLIFGATALLVVGQSGIVRKFRGYFMAAVIWATMLAGFIVHPPASLAASVNIGDSPVQIRGQIAVHRFLVDGRSGRQTTNRFTFVWERGTGKYSLILASDSGEAETEVYSNGVESTLIEHQMGWLGSRDKATAAMDVASVSSGAWPTLLPILRSPWQSILLPFIGLEKFKSAKTNHLRLPHPYYSSVKDPAAHGVGWEYSRPLQMGEPWGIKIKRVAHPTIEALVNEGLIDHPNDPESLSNYTSFYESGRAIPTNYVQTELTAIGSSDIDKEIPLQITIDNYYPRYKLKMRHDIVQVDSVEFVPEIPSVPICPRVTSVLDARFREVNSKTFIPELSYTLKPGEPWNLKNDPRLVRQADFFRSQAYRKSLASIGSGKKLMTTILIVIFFIGLLTIGRKFVSTAKK